VVTPSDLYVGDSAVDVTITPCRAEFVVPGPRPRTYLTITVTAAGVQIAGDLPLLDAVAWADLRELLAVAGESLAVMQQQSRQSHG